MPSKCPICFADVVGEYVDIHEHVVHEEGHRCPNNHFAYQYAHGATRYDVGSAQLHSHYSDTDIDIHINNALYSAVVQLERLRWDLQQKKVKA